MRRIIFIISLCMLTSHSWGQAPGNDLCTGATSTTPDGTCYAGTTVNANDNIASEAGCATQAGPNAHRDVWYSFTATTTTVNYNITSPSGSTIELVLMSGTCGTLSLVNSSCQTSPLVTTFAGLTIGQIYYYTVSFPSNVGSSFTTCVTSLATPPSAGQNCTSALPLCSNSSFGGNSSGFGTQELNSSNRGCLLANERQSSWYYFQVQTGGTLEMTISPTISVDYDFALWGPLTSYQCPVAGSPIRCSWASEITTFSSTGSYNTGFGPSGTEASDGTAGTLDGWASTLNVLAGQFYILCIDNYTMSNTPFNLSWGGTAVLSCALVPIELTEFNGKKFDNHNVISWTTASEENNKLFVLEHSTDARYFYEVFTINGAGNSHTMRRYYYRDYRFNREKINYYRLRQIDDNGTDSYSTIIAINNFDNKTIRSIVIYDMLGKEHVDAQDLKGLFFILTEYEDGTFFTEKKWFQ